jgi:hypothetical protein
MRKRTPSETYYTIMGMNKTSLAKHLPPAKTKTKETH